MASFVDLRQAVLFAILTLLAVPLPARSLLTTADGAEILGDVEPAEFELAIDAGDVIVPRVAVDHLRTLPDGTVEITLKDGKTLAGRLDTQLLITDGLIKRRLQPADVREIAFDVFVPITGESVAEVVGDEGELNIFAPVKLWTETAAFDPDGPPLALRFQLLTRERGTDAEPGPVFVWFVKIR
ncbi:MAG TPA: hypothetical protein VGG06_03970 [Thermoanaerobaculia bacterium]|jgi:hypothetical protein